MIHVERKKHYEIENDLEIEDRFYLFMMFETKKIGRWFVCAAVLQIRKRVEETILDFSCFKIWNDKNSSLYIYIFFPFHLVA